MCRDELFPNVVELFSSFNCRLDVKKFGMVSQAYVRYVFPLIEWKNNRFETAVLYAMKAEELDPQNVEISALIKNANVEKALICGNNCLGSGRFLDAITHYEKGIKFYNISKVNYNIAFCNFKLNWFQQCTEKCSEALSINPNYKMALILRANSYTKATNVGGCCERL